MECLETGNAIMNCCRQLLKGKMDNEEVTLQLQEVSAGKAPKSVPTGKDLVAHHPRYLLILPA